MKKITWVFLALLFFSEASSAVCAWVERYCVSPGQASCYVGHGSCRDRACILGTNEKMTLYEMQDHEMVVRATAMRNYTISDYDQCTKLTESDYM